VERLSSSSSWHRAINLTTFAAIAALWVACSGDPDDGSPTPLPPSITAFSAAPEEVAAAGDTTTLSWSTTNATSISLQRNGAPVDLDGAAPGSGTLEVEIEETSTFVLRAFGDGAPAEQSLVVTLAGSAPSIASFTAPEAVEADESGGVATLAWTGIGGAEQVTLQLGDQAPFTIAPSQLPDGSMEVSITTDTTFTLTAANEAGETSRQATTRLVRAPVIGSFETDRSWIGIGEEFTLSWTTSFASHVELWVDGVREEAVEPAATAGGITLAASLDTEVELRAFNELGVEVREALQIVVAAPVIAAFSVDDPRIWLGTSFQFDWLSQGGTDLQLLLDGRELPLCASQDPETIDESGCAWSPEEGGEAAVTLQVQNASGVASESLSLYAAAGPVILSFTTDRQRFDLGEEVVLGWSVVVDPDDEAPTLELVDDLSGSYEASGLEGSLTATLTTTGTRTFTLRATTSSPLSQQAEATAEVEVLALPVVGLTATPTLFDDTESDHVLLEWTSENAVSLVLYRLQEDGEPLVLRTITGAEIAAGSLELVPQEDAVYRIVAENGTGTQASEEVEVRLAPPEVLAFTANPTAVVPGQGVELAWNSKMGHEVSLSIVQEGYIAEEITEPYIDAAQEGGTHLPVTTECGENIRSLGCAVLEFPAGFAFPFDGAERSSARIYTNGFLSFDTAQAALVQSGNRAFPTGSSYGYVHMAPFWDSLGWDETRYPVGNLHYLLLDEGGKRSLVIQWKDVSFLTFRNASLNFEVVLHESGEFEYRYSTLDPGTAPAHWIRGSDATIGFQDFNQRSAHTRLDGATLGLPGVLYGRTFAYKLAPAIGRSGSYLWHPFSNSNEAKVTLTVQQGERTDTRTLTVEMADRPIIEVEEKPSAPVFADEEFRIGWKTTYATAVELLGPDGSRICEAGPTEIEAGFCRITQGVEGTHTYFIRATGAHGFTLDLPVQVSVYEDFGIVHFEVDREVVEHGENVTVSWETYNVAELQLMANGQDLPIDPASGSFVFEDIQQNTFFLLLAKNSFGMTKTANASAQVWKIRMELTPTTTSVRPGEEVVVQVNATDTDGGGAPTVYGTFPLQEVANSPYQDITSVPGARSIGMVSAPINVDFPEGFSFPYFGTNYTSMRVFESGYISFDLAANHATMNQRLPNGTSTNNSNVHLAPFWDSLSHRNFGSMWVAQPTPDTFVLQWHHYSPTSGTTISVFMDLNFQIVFYRDGAFEFRYGAMNPLPEGQTNNGCHPNTCVNESNGSSATIGYQMPAGELSALGYGAHFGGTSNNAANRPFPGGLSNRTLRYQPLVGSGSFTYAPIANQTLAFCSISGSEPVCKYLPLQAEFRLDSFTAASERIEYDQPVMLNWESVGGRELWIRDGDTEIFHTTDVSVIDKGSFEVRPTRNTTYSLQITATENSVSAQTTVIVERARFTANVSSGSSFPGDPVTLSWTATKTDPAMDLVIVKPLEEQFGASFSELDLEPDLEAIRLIAYGVDNEIARLDFDGFTFPFAGESRTAVMVSSEGYLSFDMNQATANPNNQRFPTANATYKHVHIAPFWDDFHTRINGKVLAKKVGTDRYVIQWSGTSLRRGSSDMNEFDLNFMVVLHANGDFEYRYGLMREPPIPVTSTSDCNPVTCETETNGAAATIGYQEPSGTLGYNLHYAGLNPSASQLPIAGNLSNRSWRFRAGWQSSSVEVRPADTTIYEICALDPVSGDVFCSGPVQVAVNWGITSFDANPWAPRAGQPTTLQWEVRGLDTLVLRTEGGPIIASYTRDDIPSPGSNVQTPPGNTEYVLEGTSLGRRVEARRLVEMRQFDLDLQIPPGPFFPGDEVTLTWSSTTYEPGQIMIFGPMDEIAAGPGDGGAFVDISGEPLASPVTFQSTTSLGYASIALPFAFPYFGGTHDQAVVYIDGYLSFDPALLSGQGTNQPLPNSTSTLRRIHLAPFWDDLIRRGGHEMIYTHQLDADTFVIQWKNFSRNSGSSTTNLYDLNFEIVLFRDGSFEYRYGKMDAPPQPFSSTACFPSTCVLEANGSSATIGYQTIDGLLGNTLHYGGATSTTVVPFEGGLAGRSFRYQASSSGSAKIKVGATRDHEICALMNGFSDCKSVTVEAIAKAGELMFTELMIDPAGGPDQQWFEIRNVSRRHIDLKGFELRGLQGSRIIESALPVAPGAYVTFGPGPSAGFTPDYSYGTSLPLVANADRLELRAGTLTVAEASWGATWYVPAGQTLSLDPSYQVEGVVSNDTFEQWCPSGAGTPGTLGKGCRYPYMDLDLNSRLPFRDISLTGTRVPALEQLNQMRNLPITGFSMPFFDTVANTFWVGSNGWVSFSTRDPGGADSPAPTGANWLPRGPSFTPTGPLVAAFFDALSCSFCAFHYETQTVEGQAVLIFQWTGYVSGNKPGSITFQAQLWEDGDVVIAFADAQADDPGDQFYYEGALAWIGVEAPDRMDITAGIRNRFDLAGRTFHFVRR